MVQTCVSQNFGIAGGELSIEPWSLPRHVHDATYNSVGDGTFTELTSLPGKLMVDSGVISWTSDSPLPARLLIRVQRGPRVMHVSNPNAVQIRDRWTVSTNGTTPRTPDVSSTYQGQSGASIDLSANSVGQPLIGQYWVWEDAALTEDWSNVIEPGGTFKLWYRCNLWTPPPWSNNANNGSPQHDASVGYTRIQLIAFPQADTAVSS